MKQWNMNAALATLAALILVALWIVPTTRPHAEARRLALIQGSPYSYRQWDESWARGVDDFTRAIMVAGFTDKSGLSVAQNILYGQGQRKPSELAQGIRKVSYHSVFTPYPSAPLPAATRTAAGQIQLDAARQGIERDPENGFFPMAKACAHAILRDDPEKVVQAVERAAALPVLNSYIADDLALGIGLIQHKQGFLRDTDRGSIFSQIHLSHVTQWMGLASYTLKIKDDRLRLRLVVALIRLSAKAKRDDRLDYEQFFIGNLGAHAIEKAAGRYADPSARAELASLARSLGMVEEAGLIESAKPKAEPLSRTAEKGLEDKLWAHSVPFFGFGLLAALGLGLWILSQLEPNRGLTLALCGTSLLIIASTFPWSQQILVPFGAIAFFASFLFSGIPGSRTLAWVFGGLAVLAFAVTHLIAAPPRNGPGWFVIALVWALPFAVRYGVRWAMWPWLASGFAFFVLAAFAFFMGNVRVSWDGPMFQTVADVVPGPMLVGQWLLAMGMALTKRNLAETAKVWLDPVPIILLGLSVWSASVVLSDTERETHWTRYINEKAPKMVRETQPATFD